MSQSFSGPMAPLTTTQNLRALPGGPSFRVSALGGGHGLKATLSALRIIAAEHLTAICTVADDGGSSGRLRHDMDVLPPGDLRMALTALCDDTDWGKTWADVMQHRFTSKDGVSGSLDDHAMGNLLIVALWELLGDPVDGLRWAGALLGARGQVLPMSRTPLTMSGLIQADPVLSDPVQSDPAQSDPAHPDDGTQEQVRISSQAQLAHAGMLGRLTDMQIHPAEAEACAEAVTAIELSDWVVFGPGSWYTSVLPHLLLDDLRSALYGTEAKRCVVMNLNAETSETRGMSPAEHLEVITHYAPDLHIDAIIADPQSVRDEEQEAFAEAAQRLGAEITYARVRSQERPDVHDHLRLAIAFNEVFDG